MVKKDMLYKCNICGNIVSVVYNEENSGKLFCCNEKMKELPVLSGEEGLEKHKPIIEKQDQFVIVNVGSIDHPMEEDHYITLIQLLHKGRVIKEKHLNPGDRPRAKFSCRYDLSELSARAYCNKHGLWSN